MEFILGVVVGVTISLIVGAGLLTNYLDKMFRDF